MLGLHVGVPARGFQGSTAGFDLFYPVLYLLLSRCCPLEGISSSNQDLLLPPGLKIGPLGKGSTISHKFLMMQAILMIAFFI
jgi:hypothetical protein